MVAMRGLTNRANIHTLQYVKKSFKTQHGRIPINPAIFAAIGHRFITKKKTKNADALVWGDAHRDQKPEIFWVLVLGPQKSLRFIVIHQL